MSLLTPPTAARRGMTLTEMIVTSVLGIIVVLGVAKLDVARTVMELNIHQEMAAAQPNRFGAALASLKIAESLTRADRAVVTGPDGDGLYALQVRVPACNGEDTACGNWEEQHRWEQYSVDTSTTPWQLVYYASDHKPNSLLYCGKHRVLASEITGLEFAFEDEEPLTPPGGEPNFSPLRPSGGGEDNNMVSYAITWSNGVQTQVFRGQAMTRAQGYTDVAEGGLVDPRGAPFGDPSPPPALCAGPAAPQTARTPRACIPWTASFGGWPCTVGGGGCFTDSGGVTTCAALCGIVVGVVDRERRSYCVDVPPGMSQMRLRSIYLSGAPQCGRYYHRLVPPDDSGGVVETCAGSGADGGNGDCVWNAASPAPGRWHVDIVGDTPTGTCDETTLIMGLDVS